VRDACASTAVAAEGQAGRSVTPRSFCAACCNVCRVPCLHCGRRFAALVAERHVPKCAEAQARPNRLAAGGEPGALVVVACLTGVGVAMQVLRLRLLPCAPTPRRRQGCLHAQRQVVSIVAPAGVCCYDDGLADKGLGWVGGGGRGAE
jgi:hypothetical protein